MPAMRLRSGVTGDETPALQMTPMIDIVFLLLVYFILTFKVIAPEGDFDIRLPRLAAEPADQDHSLPPLRLRLASDPLGGLDSVTLNESVFPPGDWDRLHVQLAAMLDAGRGPSSWRAQAEMVLDCDSQLHYRHVIDALTAVSGSRDQRGEIVRLIEKVSFAPTGNR